MGVITKRVLFTVGVGGGAPRVTEELAAGFSREEIVEVGKAAGSWLSIGGVTVLSFRNCVGDDDSV